MKHRFEKGPMDGRNGYVAGSPWRVWIATPIEGGKEPQLFTGDVDRSDIWPEFREAHEYHRSKDGRAYVHAAMIHPRFLAA